MRQTVFALVVLLVTSTFAVSKASNKQDSRKETRTVQSFHGIKVSSGIDLFLQQGNPIQLNVEADKDIIDDLKTEVKDGILHIYINKNLSWGWNRTRKVYLICPQLDLLDASAGADVKAEGIFKSEEISIETSSGSDAEVVVEASKVRISTSSGSDAKVSGTTNELRASSSSGSDLDASELKARIVKVSASSGSDADVYASEKIDADASSGGDISYGGNPTQKNINESSGGDVSKR